MTITAIRQPHRPKYGIHADRMPTIGRKDAVSEASITERINAASRRCEALRRQLLADGAQWLSNRETLRTELTHLEKELVGLFAQKRAVLAGMEII